MSINILNMSKDGLKKLSKSNYKNVMCDCLPHTHSWIAQHECALRLDLCSMVLVTPFQIFFSSRVAQNQARGNKLGMIV